MPNFSEHYYLTHSGISLNLIQKLLIVILLRLKFKMFLLTIFIIILKMRNLSQIFSAPLKDFKNPLANLIATSSHYQLKYWFILFVINLDLIYLIKYLGPLLFTRPIFLFLIMLLMRYLKIFIHFV